ncbi:hypothetical protein ZWY2020_030395 [Hordeum vulgare]|nr:hypothetical protein ZWY2020_030395 [Hordeum vulgare]
MTKNINEAKWSKPDPRFIKINVDATFYPDEGVGATTTIIRDDRGNFIGAQCKFIPFAADIITTEALAMRDGLVFANALGCNQVEAESDSLQLINFCNGQATWWDVIFKHCYQSCNQAAHVLAYFCYCNKTSSSWLDESPDIVISKLVDDVNPF